MEGTVFSIEEFATFDGPGIRTTVFLKGCPLSCVWCHNPEGQAFYPEYIRSRNGCLECGLCESAAKVTVQGERRLSEKSAALCPRNLLRRVGEVYTPEALAARLLKNADILNSAGGGVTFSGGEPLAQHRFLTECLSLLSGKLHRAVQTAGLASEEVFRTVLSATDYMLFDLKLINPHLFRRHCGGDNAEILRNYRILTQSGIPFVTRVPLIPSVTDTEENMEEIATLLDACGVRYIELLPYNKLTGGKYPALLRTYAPPFDEGQEVALPTALLERHGITAGVM